MWLISIYSVYIYIRIIAHWRTKKKRRDESRAGWATCCTQVTSTKQRNQWHLRRFTCKTYGSSTCTDLTEERAKALGAAGWSQATSCVRLTPRHAWMVSRLNTETAVAPATDTRLTGMGNYFILFFTILICYINPAKLRFHFVVSFLFYVLFYDFFKICISDNWFILWRLGVHKKVQQRFRLLIIY